MLDRFFRLVLTGVVAFTGLLVSPGESQAAAPRLRITRDRICSGVIGITEWSTTGGEWGLGRAMLWTLDNALWCSRYHNFMHRHCDIIEIANRSNLADSFCSGIIQSDNHDLFKTPTYYAEQLYATRSGQYPLRLVTDGGGTADPVLDVSATLSERQDRVAIFVVNPTLETQQRTIDVSAFGPLAGEVDVSTLADTAQANERDAANSWREPKRVRAESTKAASAHGELVHPFPALSLTVLEIQLQDVK